MIKSKVGKCKDCPPGAPHWPLIAGRCQSHYWQYRKQVSTKKPQAIAKSLQQQGMSVFFASQMPIMPDRCQESNQPLPKSPTWLRKACMAHILPKRKEYGFPSVDKNPLNLIFLHPDIHTNMDNLGESYIVKMKCFPLMKERVAQLIPLLTPEERRRLPHYFEP